MRKFTSQGKTKTTGGKANERDEYSIANTPEATSTFPRHELLWKKFGAHFAFVSELSPSSENLFCLLFMRIRCTRLAFIVAMKVLG